MACLGISLGNLLPSWFKRFVPIPSPDRSTSPSRNNCSPEGIGPHGSCRSAVNWRTGYVSGITELPCPPAAHLPASLKSTMDEDVFPITRSRTRRKPSAVYSPSLGMLFIPVLFILFWVWCTNSVDIKRILKYVGVRYQPDTPYYLWLFVRYDDSALGYVGVPPLSFNANVSLQKELKKIVPESEWEYLQQKYGFAFVMPVL